jgi:hypothetical protein
MQFNTSRRFGCTRRRHIQGFACKIKVLHSFVWRPGIAQSVQRLITGWTVRGSNLGGGEIFRPRPDQPWGPPTLLYNGYHDFPGVKRPGRGVDYPTHLESRMKKVQLYLYFPVCAFVGCSRVHLTFTFYLSAPSYDKQHDTA